MGLISDLMKKKQILAFAEHTAGLMAQRLPVHKLKDEKRRQAEFEIALGHIQGFQRKENLGFLGKSLLINQFQWKLIDAGYAQDNARDIGREITMRLSKKSAPTI